MVTTHSEVVRQGPATVTERSAARSAVRRRGKRLTRRGGTGVALTAPAFLLVLTFVVVPLGFAVYISLTDWPLVGQPHFVGLRNYRNLAINSGFLHSVLFTVKYTAIVTVPILAVGYGLAVLVRTNRRGAVFFRTLFFLPYVVGLVAESFMLLLELQPGSGAVDAVLSRFGIVAPDTAWLVQSGLALTAISVLVVWYASGLTMLLLTAGMQGIPRELYESAAVDGAGWWRRELRVTLPLLRRPIALSLIISVIGSFLAFTQFYVLTHGGPGSSTDTVVMWIYQTGFVRLRLGAATAMSLVLMVVVGLISAAQFLLLRKED